MNDVDLTALVSSRICHDLISPIGAIGNGVELITVLGNNSSPEMDLIGESASSATAKLRFFRIAFGAATNASMISAAEARDIVSAMFQGRFKAVWEIDRDLHRLAVKALFLSLLCVEKATPLGGTAMIMGTDPLSIVVSASKLSKDEGLWGYLENKGTTALTPSLVQFPLLKQLSSENHFSINQNFSETTIELRLQGLNVAQAESVTS